MAYATINKGASYFTPTLYTGTGSSQSITTVGFKPDWVWIKDRTSANNHREYDIIRGATVELYPNLTDADTTQAQSLTSFNSNGFSLGNLAQVNTNGNNYVSWNWLAANSTTTNTSGTITSTVSANTTSGFSIVSYTGNGTASTIGHGLGATPKMIITKKRSSTSNWAVYHASLLASQDIRLNLTDAVRTSNGSWNGTRPTSTVFSVQDDDATNLNGATYIGYCFAEIKGFSKFSSFVGNGSSDGTFVYTGFKPAWIMWKRSDGISSWGILDTTRDTYNVATKYLLAEASDAEASTTFIDFVSNGFKLRTSSLNASGATYIYACFASNPFVLTDGTPVTAR